MIEKIQLFFEAIMMPLSWMPDICLELIGKVVFALAIFVLAFFIAKVVHIFR